MSNSVNKFRRNLGISIGLGIAGMAATGTIAISGIAGAHDSTSQNSAVSPESTTAIPVDPTTASPVEEGKHMRCTPSVKGDNPADTVIIPEGTVCVPELETLSISGAAIPVDPTAASPVEEGKHMRCTPSVKGNNPADTVIIPEGTVCIPEPAQAQ